MLVVELDGPAGEVEAQLRRRRADVRRGRRVRDPGRRRRRERALIWKGRKSAFAAVGRISPDYIVQDGVIPRTALSEVLRAIEAVAAEAGVRVANVFHAGDGNLHPLVLFDESARRDRARRGGLATGSSTLCLEHGGSITGEHGVGHDKKVHMGKMFNEIDLDVMQLRALRVRPGRHLQPGQDLPDAAAVRRAAGPRAAGCIRWQEAGVADVF